MKVQNCILKNAITIHFVWRVPIFVRLSLVSYLLRSASRQLYLQVSSYFEVPEGKCTAVET